MSRARLLAPLARATLFVGLCFPLACVTEEEGELVEVSVALSAALTPDPLEDTGDPVATFELTLSDLDGQRADVTTTLLYDRAVSEMRGEPLLSPGGIERARVTVRATTLSSSLRSLARTLPFSLHATGTVHTAAVLAVPDRWSALLTDDALARSGAGAFLDDDALVLVGGRDEDGAPLTTSARVSLETKSVATLEGPALFSPRVVVLAPGSALVLGGEDEGGQPSRAVWHYRDGAFTRLSFDLDARGVAIAPLSDGRALLLGGEEAPRRIALFDPSAPDALLVADGQLSEPRLYASATALRGLVTPLVLVAGGRDAPLGPALGSVELVELEGSVPVARPLQAPAAPAHPTVGSRFGHAAVLLPGARVLFLGGEDEEGAPADARLFTLEVDGPDGGFHLVSGVPPLEGAIEAAALADGSVIVMDASGARRLTLTGGESPSAVSTSLGAPLVARPGGALLARDDGVLLWTAGAPAVASDALEVLVPCGDDCG